MDLSALVADGLYVRPQVVWDAKRVDIESLLTRANSFVRHVLGRIGLELPQ